MTTDTTAPHGALRTTAFAAPTTKPYGLSDVPDGAKLSLADIDGDGDLDAFIGEQYGDTLLFLNTGSTTSPAFATPITNPYGLSGVGSGTSPSLVDIDDDGDLDAFIGNLDGDTLLYLNTGSASKPDFSGAPETNPYGLDNVGYGANPRLVDIDGDGDLDAFIGNFFGDKKFYLNTGSASSPVFAAPITNPYGLSNMTNDASPGLFDIDGDGNLDVIVGNNSGDTLVQLGSKVWVAPVAATTANGTYGAGSIITLKVKFSENVLVTGAPTLKLETGTTDRAAVYTGGSGTSTLTFKYTVHAGDTSADLDYSSAAALSLNGGTLRDAAGNDAVLTLAAPGEPGSLAAGHAIVIDTAAPTLDPVGPTDVPLRTGFYLIFNEAVVKGTGTIVLKTAAGAVIESYDVATSANLTLSDDKTTLTLNPGSDLAYSTAYKVELAAGTFKDLAGNSFAGSTSYSFTTEGTTYTGTAGADSLAGGAGSDTLDGGAGADTLAGGDGSDIYYVNSRLDVVTETNALADTGGIDQVNSTLATYTLGANIENGAILATGTASLTGNDLDNVLYAGVGSNVLDGGNEIDTVSYSHASAGIKVSLTTSAAQATGGSGSDTLRNVENLTGSSYADRLTGSGGDNTLIGGAGADTINGGAGTDVMIGGDGNDSYYVDNSLDAVSETDALTNTGGIDRVNTRLSDYTLGANIERGAILASGTASLTGNKLNNVLYAGAGSNVLDGGAGVDIVSYYYASGGVTVSLATTDSQATGSSGSDTLLGVENLNGSNYGDTLAGSAGNNGLSGGSGNDALIGGQGTDKLTGGAGADRFNFNSLDELGLSSATRDTITDFNTSEGDTIDLLGVDANAALAGDQSFRFLGTVSAFTGNATGQLRFDAAHHVLYGSTDADTAAEFAIVLSGVSSLSTSDFAL